MPLVGDRRPGARHVLPGLALVVCMVLSGCMDGRGFDPAAFPMVAKLGFGKGRSPAEPMPVSAMSEPVLTGKGQVVSPLIDSLRARPGALHPGTPFALVADSVLQASKGAAYAELQVARLRAQAKAKNWLPSIGPNVSLSSLGAVAASILVEQALFDNGRRSAERAYAAADVEVAAVTLAQDLNDRVHQGLNHYVAGQRSVDLITVTEQAMGRMAEFERIMAIRVDGGLSDRSEQQVLTQKYAEMQATLSADRQALATARAELAAMSAGGIEGLSGLGQLWHETAITEPLSVMKSRGEGARLVAEAEIARAGALPGLGAQAAVDGDGDVDAGLTLGGATLGFGTGDTLRALAATRDVAARKVAEARETSDRRIVALEREIATLLQKEIDGAAVLRQATANLALFTEQYKAGRKTLLELVAQFETFTRMQREQASLKYEIAVLHLDAARERGTLVSGAAM